MENVHLCLSRNVTVSEDGDYAKEQLLHDGQQM